MAIYSGIGGSMQTAGLFPSILVIGNLWFWYPMPGGSLLNKIGPMVYVIDQFSSMLSSLLAIDNKRMILIGSKSGLTESDWANEPHPTGTGFKKLAQN